VKQIQVRGALIAILRDSAYGRMEFSEERKVEICKRLGILPELLQSAQEEYQRLADGCNLEVSSRNRRSYLNVDVARHFREKWLDYAKRRKVRHTVLFRSVIYHYLKGTYEPTYLAMGSSRDHDFTSSKERLQIRATVPWGTRQAFIARARALQVGESNILRALLIETMQGVFGRPGSISYVSLGQMPSDARKYYVPEHLRE